MILFILLILLWLYILYIKKIHFVLRGNQNKIGMILTHLKKSLYDSYYYRLGLRLIIYILKIFVVTFFIFYYSITNTVTYVVFWKLLLYIILNLLLVFYLFKRESNNLFILLFTFFIRLFVSFVTNSIIFKFLLFGCQLVTNVTVPSIFSIVQILCVFVITYDHYFDYKSFPLNYIINMFLLLLLSKLFDKLCIFFIYLFITHYFNLNFYEIKPSYYKLWKEIYNLYERHIELGNNINEVFIIAFCGFYLLSYFIYYYLFQFLFSYIILSALFFVSHIDTFFWFLVDNHLFPLFLFNKSLTLSSSIFAVMKRLICFFLLFYYYTSDDKEFCKRYKLEFEPIPFYIVIFIVGLAVIITSFYVSYFILFYT